MQGRFQKEGASAVVVAMLALTAIYGFPTLEILRGSVFDHGDLGSRWHYVGGANYRALLESAALRQSILASTAFSAATVILQVGTGLALALLTNRVVRSVPWLPGVLIAPYFLPSVVVVLAWRFLTDPFVGLLPSIQAQLGLRVPDYRAASWALPAMVITATYEAFPFAYAVLLARRLVVPKALYEVAELDGAGAWAQFRSVTWPQMRTTVLGLFLLRVLLTWLKFDIPWLVYASQAVSLWGDTLGVYVFRIGFELLEMGRAYALCSSLLVSGAGLLVVWLVAQHYVSRPTVRSDRVFGWGIEGKTKP